MSVLRCPECGGSMWFPGDQLMGGEVAECRDCDYSDGPYMPDEIEELLDLEEWDDDIEGEDDDDY